MSATPPGAANAPRRTQILLASTLYGAATLAAALDDDVLPAADRRLLLVCNNAATPETTPGLTEMAGFQELRGRFDEIRSWNETISPFHPGGWGPRPDDVVLWERYLRLTWGLGDDPVELVVESLQVNPALAVCQIFTGAPVTVYADGLMSYGPTRNKLDPLVGTRVDGLLHLDLVPGLRPLLLTEFEVPARTVATETFLKVLGEVAAASPELPGVQEGAALLLGQYLSALSILTAEEEEELHLSMLRGALTRGHRDVVFKPHPSAPARFSRRLEAEAEQLGVRLTVLDVPVLAEVVYERARPALVVGCFSTALLTASAFYGLPTARLGTDMLLERLAPYENSNRVPVTIVDALVPDLAADAGAQPAPTGVAELTGLLEAVGYAMQHQIYPNLRPAAERYLAAHLTQRTWRYFKRRRLTVLGLPGAIPAQLAFIPRNQTVRAMARRARAVQRRLKKRAAFS